MSTSQPNLHPEIIEAILLRLPPKTLGRFKSVSKTWDSLISHPRFIKTHVAHINKKPPHQTTKIILVSNTCDSLYSVDIKDLRNKGDNTSATAKEISLGSSFTIRWEKILGSCNGLVLAVDVHKTLFVMNPTTKELSDVPRVPFPLNVCNKHKYELYNFGYVPSTNNYKVVSISFHEFDDFMYVRMYSLNDNSWKELPNAPYCHYMCRLSSGVLVNQNLHWLTTKPSEYVTESVNDVFKLEHLRTGYSWTIVAFSLENEEFHEIELPDWIDNNKVMHEELFAIDGKLCLLGSRAGYNLWVMEEYGVGKSWTKVCSHEGVGLMGDHARPMCLIEGIDREIVMGDEDKVVVYNINEKRHRNLRINGGPSESQTAYIVNTGFHVGGTYIESLEWLKTWS